VCCSAVACGDDEICSNDDEGKRHSTTAENGGGDERPYGVRQTFSPDQDQKASSSKLKTEATFTAAAKLIIDRTYQPETTIHTN
jgi:hypothetical protein